MSQMVNKTIVSAWQAKPSAAHQLPRPGAQTLTSSLTEKACQAG